MSKLVSVQLCECGCGLPTPLSDRTDATLGLRKGEPRRFRKGHRITTPWQDNFWKYVTRGGPKDCWEWLGSKTDDGYGVFHVRRLTEAWNKGAHRVAYELLVGPIGEGLTLDHTCVNTSCINPAHLEPVTQRENLLRGNTVNAINAAKTHCINGHAFTVENTYIRPDDGTRMCKECGRDSQRKYQRRLAARG